MNEGGAAAMVAAVGLTPSPLQPHPPMHQHQPPPHQHQQQQHQQIPGLRPLRAATFPLPVHYSQLPPNVVAQFEGAFAGPGGGSQPPGGLEQAALAAAQHAHLRPGQQALAPASAPFNSTAISQHFQLGGGGFAIGPPQPQPQQQGHASAPPPPPLFAGHEQRERQQQPQRQQQQPVNKTQLEDNENQARVHNLVENLNIVPNPPELEGWRRKLFHVEDTLVLTEDEFNTYFAHVDNVYSHRSTQAYKKKNFVVSYWDCRLKGRPSGTKKSDDPNKKKRKRTKRELNLCDMKIKITEFWPGSYPQEYLHKLSKPLHWYSTDRYTCVQSGYFDQLSSKIYTVQRVHGGVDNEQTFGPAGAHKHDIVESDRVKKNTVIRTMMQNDRDKLKPTKTYHKKATGAALETVKNHSAKQDLRLYGSCFCPFVQRVWISLELKQMPYQYIEVDPYQKPKSLLRLNPRGLVPAIAHGDWACYESSVLMEYLEDLNEGQALLPASPKERAYSRLWSDHINRHIVPCFYRFLQEQDTARQVTYAEELTTEITKLVKAADPTGPFFLGPNMSFVDVQIAPWIIRLRRVLKPYRGFPEPDPQTRWGKLVNAIEENEATKATVSDDQLYLDSYERYAENRPDTSQVARAVNSGRGLP
ncbi:hypothetical protein BDY21DRAFT_418789 [Lineolata rhizophorae]|uniref:Glutathione S-transferase n=1 Tax=Lineolata rhizophorae TaxID=578093 RepID=A0A6A6PAI4_9PEZI|nr:hypothetical protein BDY21DRAFT_418789 [Lineolata rhizophorae]